MRTSQYSRIMEAAEALDSPASRASVQSSASSVAVSVSNAPEVTQVVTHDPLVLAQDATLTLVSGELSYAESSVPPLKSASDTESEPSGEAVVLSPKKSKSKKKETPKVLELGNPNGTKKPARKSKKVSKKLKKVKIPKTPSEPKIDPKLEQEIEEVDTPESSPEPKKDPQLIALEQQSENLSKKIRTVSERRDRAHARRGHDHPSVKKLNRQLRGLSVKLRNVAAKRYAFRSTSRRL